MINKLLSIILKKNPQSKKYFTVMREKNINGINDDKCSIVHLQKRYILDANDRGKIYNALFSACSQR